MVALTRWIGAVLAAAGWLVVLGALGSATPSSDQTVDLEAGGGFAATIDVFLPAVALSAVLVVVLLVGAALRRPDVAALVTGLTTAAFIGWVLRLDYYVSYLPDLPARLAPGGALGLVGLLLGVLSWGPRPEPAPTPEHAAGLTSPP